MFESSPRESVGFWGSFQGPAAEGATGPRKRSGTQDRDREQDLWKAGTFGGNPLGAAPTE